MTPKNNNLDIVASLSGDELYEKNFFSAELPQDLLVSLPSEIEDIFSREGQVLGSYEEILLEDRKNIEVLRLFLVSVFDRIKAPEQNEIASSIKKMIDIIDHALSIGGPVIFIT